MSFKSVEQSFLARVKLLPWTQFVGTWFAVLNLLVFTLAKAMQLPAVFAWGAHWGAVVGASLAFLALGFEVVRKAIPGGLERILQYAGLGAAIVLAGYLRLGLVIPCFIALGFSQAGQWYEQIYP